MLTQQTYTCRCGRKLPLLKQGESRTCGCGREHIQQDKLVIKDKKRKS